MWIYDLYQAMRSGAAGIQPVKIVSRAPGFNFGGNNAVVEEGGPSPAPAPAATTPNAGGRWFEALRFPTFGRRLQSATAETATAQGPGRMLQAQKYQCVRSKVTF